MDPEEIMRRVPGITRKEADYITKVFQIYQKILLLLTVLYHNS